MERVDKNGNGDNGLPNGQGMRGRRPSITVGDLNAKLDKLREDKDAAIEYFAKKKVSRKIYI